MTSIAHRYTNFSSFDAEGSPPDPMPMERVEDEKLQAFEEGYQAGWTDADKNHTEEQRNIGNEFLHTLRDLSFTYQEAASRINRSLKALFEQMSSTLLPQTVTAALKAHLVEQLAQIAATQTEGKITLRVADCRLQVLEELLAEEDTEIAITVIPDQSLTPNQLFISLDMVEREINLDLVCQEITTAMNAFNYHTEPESLNV